jgi:hypothetical protein
MCERFFYHVITKETVYGGLARVPPGNSCADAQGQWSKAMHLLGTLTRTGLSKLWVKCEYSRVCSYIFNGSSSDVKQK